MDMAAKHMTSLRGKSFWLKVEFVSEGVLGEIGVAASVKTLMLVERCAS